MKRDFNAWLKTLGAIGAGEVADRAARVEHGARQGGAIKYGQSKLDISDEMDVEGDRARYEADRARDIALAGEHGFNEAIESNKLDALMFPGWNVSNLASRPGYPEIVVPIGRTPAGGGGGIHFRSGLYPQPTPL